MADETTTATEAQPAAAAATTTAQAHPTGGGAGEPRPDPLPDLDVGDSNEKWVLYLQQMLNYHYQSQVVPESGHYDGQTGDVVNHFRSQQRLNDGTKTDKDVWEKLGVQDPLETWLRSHPQGAAGGHPPAGAYGDQHGAQHGQQHAGAAEGQHDQHDQQAEAYEPIYFNAELIPAPNEGACWAASMAMVLNTKGGSNSVESVCEHGHIDINDHKSASDTRSIGNELGLQLVVCDGSTPHGWAQALASVSGPLWAPNPQNDNNILVIAGVSGTGAEAIIHVMDPVSSLNDWMNFAQFTANYGFGNHHELLG